MSFHARKLFPAFWKLEESLVRFFSPSFSLALTNEGLFELTRRPSFTRAVSLSSAETTKNSSRSQLKMAFSLNYDQVLGSFCGWWQDGPCQFKLWNSLKLFPMDNFSNYFSPMVIGENGGIFTPAPCWMILKILQWKMHLHFTLL